MQAAPHIRRRMNIVIIPDIRSCARPSICVAIPNIIAGTNVNIVKSPDPLLRWHSSNRTTIVIYSAAAGVLPNRVLENKQRGVFLAGLAVAQLVDRIKVSIGVVAGVSGKV